MKTINQNKRGFGSKWLPLIAAMFLSAIVMVSCSKDDDNDVVNNNPYTITGIGTGSQVTPAVADTGTAAISGTYNPTNRLLSYTTNWTNLSGVPTGGGLYNGAPGNSGTAIGNAWSFDSSVTGTGSRSDTITLTEDQASQLIAGNMYYSFSTANNPGGEVRGQITATR